MTGTDALRTWIEASARYREQLELAYAATVLTPGHDREYAYELWRAITEAWEHEQRWTERLACDDRTLLAGECERMRAGHDVRRVLERHTRADVEPDGTPLDAAICTECDGRWPCDAVVLAAEVERYKRLWRDDPEYSDDVSRYCFWCSAEDEYFCNDTELQHDSDCPWLLLRDTDALTSTTRGEGGGG